MEKEIKVGITWFYEDSRDVLIIFKGCFKKIATDEVMKSKTATVLRKNTIKLITANKRSPSAHFYCKHQEKELFSFHRRILKKADLSRR